MYTQSPADQGCQSRERFVWGVSNESGTKSGTVRFLPYAYLARFDQPVAICVWVNYIYNTDYAGEPQRGEVVVAQATYTPTPWPLTPLPTGPGDMYNCPDFSSQLSAQEYYNRYPGDPSRLDADNDGLACDANLCPCVAVLSPLPRPVHVSRSLGMGEAKAAVRGALKRRFGRRFTRRRAYRSACRRTSSYRVICAVRWRYTTRRYIGNVTVRAIDADTLSMRVRVRRR